MTIMVVNIGDKQRLTEFIADRKINISQEVEVGQCFMIDAIIMDDIRILLSLAFSCVIIDLGEQGEL